MSDSTAPESFFGTAPQPASDDAFASAKASALKAADDLRTAAAAKAAEIRQAAEARANQFKDAAGDKVDDIRQFTDKAISGARDQAQSLASEAEKFAREKPMQALLAAFGAGFVVGLILRR